MACRLIAPNHHLNQYWLLINEVLWHSPESNSTANAQVNILCNEFEKLYFWNSCHISQGPPGAIPIPGKDGLYIEMGPRELTFPKCWLCIAGCWCRTSGVTAVGCRWRPWSVWWRCWRLCTHRPQSWPTWLTLPTSSWVWHHRVPTTTSMCLNTRWISASLRYIWG